MQDTEILEKSGCVRCGKPSKNGGKGGRCSSCLKKLAANKKKPGHYLHSHKLADDALKRQDGKTETASKKSKGRGTRASIIKQVNAAYKKHGKDTTLSPDRKSNDSGYSAKNTRMVPKKLNRGRHNVDQKKLKAWKSKMKKHNIDWDDLSTLLQAHAYETGQHELLKSLEILDLNDLFNSPE